MEREVVVNPLIMASIISILIILLSITGLSGIILEKPVQLHHGISLIKINGRYFLLDIHVYHIPQYRRVPGYTLSVKLDITIDDRGDTLIDNRSNIMVFHGSIRPEYLRILSLQEERTILLETILSRMNRSILRNNSLVETLDVGGMGYLSLIVMIPLNPYSVIDVRGSVPPIIYYPENIPRKTFLVEMINMSRNDKVIEHVLKYYLEEWIGDRLRIDITAKSILNIGLDTYLRTIGITIISLILYIQSKIYYKPRE